MMERQPIVDITYVALRTLKVGGQPRHSGELVPEAATWHNVDAYVRMGRIAPVPRASVDQQALAEAEQAWEDRVAAARSEVEDPEETAEEVEELVEGHTAEELYEQAQEADVEGRSSMDKEELAEALVEADDTEDEPSEDDALEQYHTGNGWYEVPGAEKKMRREEALEFLTSPESDEE